ncbi:hypothetical protein [Bartonella massiliensis]|nr:hypothetical protein [Bartonella massiliensis]
MVEFVTSGFIVFGGGWRWRRTGGSRVGGDEGSAGVSVELVLRG